MHLLNRVCQATAVLASGIALFGCESVPILTPGARQTETTVPRAVMDAATVVACLFQRVEPGHEQGKSFWEVKSTTTGTLLPSGDYLTAAHFLRYFPDQGDSVVIGIEGKQAIATVREYEPFNVPNGDYLVVSATFSVPSCFLADRLDAIRKKGICFDSDAAISKGQRLFVAGFVHLEKTETEPPLFGMELRVYEVVAKESPPSDPIFLIRNRVDAMQGMSGGPVLAYDESNSKITVVGTASYVLKGTLFRHPLLVASRLPPSVSRKSH